MCPDRRMVVYIAYAPGRGGHRAAHAGHRVRVELECGHWVVYHVPTWYSGLWRPRDYYCSWEDDPFAPSRREVPCPECTTARRERAAQARLAQAELRRVEEIARAGAVAAARAARAAERMVQRAASAARAERARRARRACAEPCAGCGEPIGKRRMFLPDEPWCRRCVRIRHLLEPVLLKRGIPDAWPESEALRYSRTPWAGYTGWPSDHGRNRRVGKRPTLEQLDRSPTYFGGW